MILRESIDLHICYIKFDFFLQETYTQKVKKQNEYGLFGTKTLSNTENANNQEIWVAHIQEFFVLFLQFFCKSEIIVKIKKYTNKILHIHQNG